MTAPMDSHVGGFLVDPDLEIAGGTDEHMGSTSKP